jgi:hypothetical protein|tara:strand:- start:191 stop:385 length:195 start_codon:yes stop_codon:yes gene_type:complete
MREQLEEIIRDLKEVLDDVDKVEAGSYGYKSAAPRARKAFMEVTKGLKDLRSKIQDKKKEHEEK